MQWDALTNRWPSGSEQLFGPPLKGRMVPREFAALCRTIMAHEVDPANEWRFAFWIGWAWSAPLRGSRRDKAMHLHQEAMAEETSIRFSDGELHLPLLELDDREYRVIVAPPQASLEFSVSDGPWGALSTPSMLWSSKHEWCVATEVDFDSTLVGGPTSLISEILASDELEVWGVGPGDSLASDGDLLNR